MQHRFDGQRSIVKLNWFSKQTSDSQSSPFMPVGAQMFMDFYDHIKQHTHNISTLSYQMSRAEKLIS